MISSRPTLLAYAFVAPMTRSLKVTVFAPTDTAPNVGDYNAATPVMNAGDEVLSILNNLGPYSFAFVATSSDGVHPDSI